MFNRVSYTNISIHSSLTRVSQCVCVSVYTLLQSPLSYKKLFQHLTDINSRTHTHTHRAYRHMADFTPELHKRYISLSTNRISQHWWNISHTIVKQSLKIYMQHLSAGVIYKPGTLSTEDLPSRHQHNQIANSLSSVLPLTPRNAIVMFVYEHNRE